jgi:hypothetical protein
MSQQQAEKSRWAEVAEELNLSDGRILPAGTCVHVVCPGACDGFVLIEDQYAKIGSPKPTPVLRNKLRNFRG